ncbi:MAG TPA: 50S ribosomal protein L11 methyltransferase [Vicinamibacterales bacterium]|nr:50S ribosomal protein L11 methyltransferase [Vicinamibacterales bacterium]
MPYRVDVRTAAMDTADRLIDLGALDVEPTPGAGVAALMPDRVTPAEVMAALGTGELAVSPAVPRDAGSVWVLSARPIRIGSHELRLVDAGAFGTGLHPTTALCLDALEDAIGATPPDHVLDVGTGSGVLALAALVLGVPRATGIDVDEDAIRVAAENARLNGLDRRLRLTRGGPESITGTWPLVLANVLAAPLIEMAPALVRRVGRRGRLVLSGIPAGVAADVDQAYRRLGMQGVRTASRGGWTALVLHATW